MDYGDILFKAYENKQKSEKKDVRCYVTKLPPKQKTHNSSVTKDNIRIFLAKKEEDELKKRKEEDDKKEKLIALRKEDKQAMKRVKSMLSNTKSAMKSVLPDVDGELDIKQCDEDDYGFTSQESSEMYARIVDKYIKLPEAGIHPTPKRIKIQCEVSTEGHVDSLGGIKDEEERIGTAGSEGKTLLEKDLVTNKSGRSQRGPPPISYDDLLQMAKKKQLETVIIHKPLSKKSDQQQKTGNRKIRKQSEKRVIKKRNIFILS